MASSRRPVAIAQPVVVDAAVAQAVVRPAVVDDIVMMPIRRQYVAQFYKWMAGMIDAECAVSSSRVDQAHDVDMSPIPQLVYSTPQAGVNKRSSSPPVNTSKTKFARILE